MEPGDMPQETACARSELGVVSIVFPELIHVGPHGVRNVMEKTFHEEAAVDQHGRAIGGNRHSVGPGDAGR
jgi:hypothetical protein